jgi:F-type H+-transporting ATPase subunit b
MPQIAQFADTYASQIFWLLIFFGLVFLVVGRGIVPKVQGTVELRDRAIEDDLTAAKAARDAADAEEEAWRSRENENRAAAQALIQKARDEAAARSADELKATQARIDAELNTVERSLAQSRAEALHEIEGIAAGAAHDIVERLTGAPVTEAESRHAVEEVMAHG